MKRTTILLSLALVLAFSFGAAAQFSLTGEVEFDAYLRQKWNATEEKHEDFEFWAQGRRYARLNMSASGSSGSLRLIMTLGNSQAGRHQNDADAWLPWTGDVYNPANANVQVKLDSARIEATGALWKGGQSLTAVFGRYNPGAYSPWVAHHNRVRQNNPANPVTDPDGYLGGSHRDALLNSVEVRTLNVGPFAVKAVHGYATSLTGSAQDEPTFINAKGDLGGITADITAVQRQLMGNMPVADRNNVWDLAVGLSAKPVAGLDLSGTVAIDGQGRGFGGAADNAVEAKLAFQADAKLTTVPNVTLTGSAWRADDNFAPRYAQWDRGWKDWDDADANVGNYVPFNPNRQGFKVGAETTQAGVKLTGSFANTTNVDGSEFDENLITGGVSTTIEGFDLSADVTLANRDDLAKGVTDHSTTKTVVKAGTKVADVQLNYTGTLETDKDMKNQIVAETTLDLFFADKVKFNGAVILEADEVDYGVDASWRAPNGLNFVVGYANYNKSGDLWVHQKNPDGFYIRTSAKVSF